MAVVAVILGVALIVAILWEGFEVIILPRRVTRRFRFTVFSYRIFWGTWKAIGRAIRGSSRRETWFSIYGPLSLLFLVGMWAVGIVVGFALLQWAAGGLGPGIARREGFAGDLYFSATTFITLGLGDIVPTTGWGRLLAAFESGLGFGFLALFISYFPALNQSFSRREASISLLDARAGSPPSAAEMLRRHRGPSGVEALRELLREWEHWSAELLESHQSYPVLAYFRSQHENQSWLAALTAVLDTCALVRAGLEEATCRRQAELTFAMARHAMVDLCLVFRRPPQQPAQELLAPEARAELRRYLAAAGVGLRAGAEAEAQLAQFRRMYEPYAEALSQLFAMDLPPWRPTEVREDDWQVSEWEERRGPRR